MENLGFVFYSDRIRHDQYSRSMNHVSPNLFHHLSMGVFQPLNPTPARPTRRRRCADGARSCCLPQRSWAPGTRSVRGAGAVVGCKRITILGPLGPGCFGWTKSARLYRARLGSWSWSNATGETEPTAVGTNYESLRPRRRPCQ